MSCCSNRRVLRVCNLHYSYYPLYSGARFFMESLGRQLRCRTVRVWTLTGATEDLPRCQRHMGLPVVRVGPAGIRRRGRIGQIVLFSVATACALFRLRRRYDMVLAQGFSLECAVATLVGRLLGKPVVIRLTLLGDQGRGLLRRLLGGVLRRADRVVLINPGERQSLLDAGFHPERIAAIPNGVDPDIFRPADRGERNELRRRLNLGEGPVTAFVGGLVPRKGVHHLLACWPEVLSRFPGAELLLIGPTYPEYPGLEEYTKQLLGAIKDPRMRDSVKLLGRLTQPELVDRLRAADVFVFPSEREGMPNALLEAMACGLPCAVSRFEGLNDSVGRDNLELRVVDSHEHLASTIRELLGDPDFSDRLGAAARRHVAGRYDQADTADAYRDLFASLAVPRDWRSDLPWSMARLAVISHKRIWMTPTGPVTTGGFPRQIQALASLFRGGLELCLPVAHGQPPTGATPLGLDGCKISALPDLPLGTVLGRLAFLLTLPVILWRIWRAARRADVVHVRVPGYVGLAGLLAARFAGRPRFAWLATQWAERIRSVAPGRARRVVSSVLDRLLRLLLGDTPTFSLGATYAGQLANIFPVISTSLRAADIVEELPHRPSVKDYRVLYVGRLSREKGVEHLVGSLGHLQAACPGRYRLVVVGDGPERSRLEELATSRDLAGRIEWRGQLPLDRALDAYSQAEVLVLPSLSEASGKVLLEAMARGCPVVATNVGGIPRLISDQENGLLVPPADAEALATAVGRLADDSALAIRLARAGLETARANTLGAQNEFIRSKLAEVWADRD